jgi:hypothetical protein
MAYLEHGKYCDVCLNLTTHVNGKCMICEANAARDREKALRDEAEDWNHTYSLEKKLKDLYLKIRRIEIQLAQDVKY